MNREGGAYTAITCDNSLERLYDLILTSNRSVSAVQSGSLTAMCPVLHHQTFTKYNLHICVTSSILSG